MNAKQLAEKVYTELCYKPPEQWKEVLAAAIREAFVAGKEKVLSTDQARFHANALLTGSWESEILHAAKEEGVHLERLACVRIAKDCQPTDPSDSRYAGAMEACQRIEKLINDRGNGKEV